MLNLNVIFSLVILFSVSFSSVADPEPDEQIIEPEKISFYGGRVVPHIPAESSETSVKNIQPSPLLDNTPAQRRAIHPSTANVDKHKPISRVDDKNQEARSNKLAVNNAVKIAPPSILVTEQVKTDKVMIPSLKIKDIPKKELNREELLLAKKAQYYIERNWNKKTGLIDSVQGYHHTTLWDVASGIGAILALENLELISSFDSTSRLKKTLTTIVKLPLYNDELPNREYNTHSAQPSGAHSKTASNGNGWSALDIGRLLIWLEITKQYKPELIPLINLITDKWQLNRAVHKQTLYGELKTKRAVSYRQEGRLGYLQYAAQGYQFSGFNVSTAFKQDNTTQIEQDGTSLSIDQRNLSFFTSDSYVLQAIELGTPAVWWNQLTSIYKLHKNNYAETNKLRIFAEDAMSKAPWFSYNNINIYGQPWLSTNSRGKPISNPQIFSNKVAFAFSVLFDDDFSRQLATQVISDSLSKRVIPTGLYQDNTINTAYNINTNSLILVSLWFKSRHNTAIYQPLTPSLNEPSQTLRK